MRCFSRDSEWYTASPKDVKHIPDLHLNLISTGRLDDEGCYNTFFNSQWKLTKWTLVVAKRIKNSKLYTMQAKLSQDVVNIVGNDSIVELWYKRLGYMNEKNMTYVAKMKMLLGLDQVHLKKCVDCLAGKQNRVSFKSSLSLEWKMC